MRQGRYRLGDESGQALILFVIAMPILLLVIVALVVDGTNLFVHKRSSQNAADAVALAVAHDLDPYGMPLSCAAGSACSTDAGYYGRNNDAVDPAAKTQSFADHVCASSSDLNCVDIQTCTVGGVSAACYVDKSGVAHYDKVRITVRRSLDASFGKTVGYSKFKVSASAVAHVQATGQPLFAFAMSTDCNAIRINANASDPMAPGSHFPTLWSNGGIGVNNKGNTADALLLDADYRLTCPLPDPAYLSGPPTSVPKRSVPYWPSPIPSYSCDYSANSWSINKNDWATLNPRGVYCATSKNGSVSISANNLNLVGYTFVGPDISLTGQAQNDTFGCTSSVPCRVPRTVFYATTGDVTLSSDLCTFTGTNEIYAPNGKIVFGGGSTSSFTGVMEAQTLQINAKTTTFTGSGAPSLASLAVTLDE